MIKRTLLLLGISASIIIAGCATLTKGTTQIVTINSNVDGAGVYLNGAQIGETPFASKIKKNEDALVIRKEGYKSHTLSLSKSLEPIFWGNIITGGTLGSITDWISGAAYSYSPSTYQVELYKKGEGQEAFLNRYELRRYTLFNMTDIAIDLGNNGGDHLETLIALASLPYNQESIDLIKSKFETTDGNEVRFGKEVVKLLDA
ncbi:PEGA domain-containing protein [Fodinibius halophilus]|uniref:PEGA domain-containing protein n=1 Tax=Fodinibius halophilus TaxID=1736908 RepID=A0A6M1TCF8_9BACT|nr:PEGA domain-containing protein [Fodinibius halophilus]NGP89681.1 PEGA domain-containing protein [Fodinibius halophilus]